MACQAEVHVPDCLRLVVDNKGDREMRLQLGKNEKKLILIIAEYKNYLTCIEGFPNTYLMLAESKNPNHELHLFLYEFTETGLITELHTRKKWWRFGK
ncbi:hypothetical protein YC2023_120737 [Brassica napus]